MSLNSYLINKNDASRVDLINQFAVSYFVILVNLN